MNRRIPPHLNITPNKAWKRDIMTSIKTGKGGGVYDDGTPLGHIEVVPGDNAVGKAIKSKGIITLEVSFLETDNLMVSNETMKGRGYGEPTREGPRTGRVKREAADIIRENARDGKGKTT